MKSSAEKNPFAQTDVPHTPYSGHRQPIIVMNPLGQLNRLRDILTGIQVTMASYGKLDLELPCGFQWLILACLRELLWPLNKAQAWEYF